MKTQRLAVILTVINLVFLIFNLTYLRPTTAEGVPASAARPLA